MAILGFLSDIFKPAADIVDSLHTSEEEKLAAKGQLLALQADFAAKALEYEATLVSEQAKTVRAEAEGKGLKAVWRPVVMLTFAGLVVAHWLGYTAEGLSEAEVLALLGIVKVGLAGYVIGRSAEKTVPQVIEVFKSKEKT